jgi:hypothetical protein
MWLTKPDRDRMILCDLSLERARMPPHSSQPQRRCPRGWTSKAGAGGIGPNSICSGGQGINNRSIRFPPRGATRTILRISMGVITTPMRHERILGLRYRRLPRAPYLKSDCKESEGRPTDSLEAARSVDRSIRSAAISLIIRLNNAGMNRPNSGTGGKPQGGHGGWRIASRGGNRLDRKEPDTKKLARDPASIESGSVSRHRHRPRKDDPIRSVLNAGSDFELSVRTFFLARHTPVECPGTSRAKAVRFSGGRGSDEGLSASRPVA